MEQIRIILKVLNHPTDEIEELKYRKQWHLLPSCIILLLWFIAMVFQRQLTNFEFNYNNKQDFNILYVFASTIVLYLACTGINWAVTTLLDGKGTVREIFVACSYALIPYTCTTFLNVLLSGVLIREEKVFLVIINAVGILYSVFILISALKVIHDYSFAKILFSIVLTALGIVFALFLLVLFFGLIQQVILFFRTIYVELTLRN